MSLSKKILSNTFWQILGRLITSLIGIFSIKLITNYLPTETFGQYTTIYEYIGFFAIAADFGLYTIGVREMAEEKDDQEFILGNLISLRLILITISLGTALIVTPFIPNYQDTLIQKGLPIVALTTGIGLMSGILTSVLQYKFKMVFANIALVIGRLSGFLYTAAVIFLLAPNSANLPVETSFTLLLYGGIITNIVIFLLTTYFVKKHSNIKPQINKDYAVKIVKTALPYGLSLILSTMYFKIDIILLSQLTNYHQTGIYGVPLKIMEILSVIPIFFMNSSLPALTQTYNKSKEAFQSLHAKTFLFLKLLSFPILVGGFLLAPSLTYIISSPQFMTGYHCVQNIQQVFDTRTQAYKECSKVKISDKFQWKGEVISNSNYIFLQGSDTAFKLIVVALFIAFINTFITFTLITINQQNKLLFINTIGIIFNITTNLLLIPSFGFLAAAATTIASELIIMILGIYITSRYTSLNFQISKMVKIASASIFMGIFIYATKDYSFQLLGHNHILIQIPTAGMLYALAILGLKVIDPKTILNTLKTRNEQ